MSTDAGIASSKASLAHASRLDTNPELLSDTPPKLKRGLAFWLVFLALGVCTALNALELVSHSISLHDLT
jgi:hypothetical protein